MNDLNVNLLHFIIKVFYWIIYIFQFSGLGQDNSTSLNLWKYSGTNGALLHSFMRAGFADATLGYYNLRPCPLGTFVNASRLKCVECPAGKIYIVLHNYYLNLYFAYGWWLIQITNSSARIRVRSLKLMKHLLWLFSTFSKTSRVTFFYFYCIATIKLSVKGSTCLWIAREECQQDGSISIGVALSLWCFNLMTSTIQRLSIIFTSNGKR